MIVSAFNGPNYYHLQDVFVNKFSPSFQTEVRNRFIIDSRYYADTSCYYELSNPLYQPLITGNIFYNPGMLLPYEFNQSLCELVTKKSNKNENGNENENENGNMEIKRRIFILKQMYEHIEELVFNTEYINTRRLYNEALEYDKELAEFYKNELLNSFKYMLLHMEYFINVEQIIDEIRLNTPYEYHKILKELSNHIFDSILV
jgi:hypothetical protein